MSSDSAVAKPVISFECDTLSSRQLLAAVGDGREDSQWTSDKRRRFTCSRTIQSVRPVPSAGSRGRRASHPDTSRPLLACPRLGVGGNALASCDCSGGCPSDTPIALCSRTARQVDREIVRLEPPGTDRCPVDCRREVAQVVRRDDDVRCILRLVLDRAEPGTSLKTSQDAFQRIDVYRADLGVVS